MWGECPTVVREARLGVSSWPPGEQLFPSLLLLQLWVPGADGQTQLGAVSVPCTELGPTL